MLLLFDRNRLQLHHPDGFALCPLHQPLFQKSNICLFCQSGHIGNHNLCFPFSNKASPVTSSSQPYSLSKILAVVLKLSDHSHRRYSSRVYACPKVQNTKKALQQKQITSLISTSVPSPTGAELTFKRKRSQKGRWKGHSYPFLLSIMISTLFLPLELPLSLCTFSEKLNQGKGGVCVWPIFFTTY